MKRKILPIFLSAAMIAGSLTPTYGADVFGDSAEAVVFEQEEAPEELFSAGADETEAAAKEETADAPILAGDHDPVDVRFLNGPDVTEYWYDYEMVEPSFVDGTGMRIEIIYQDGETCTYRFGDENAYVVEDDYGNLLRAEAILEGEWEEFLPVGEYRIEVVFGKKEFISDYKIRIKDPATDSSMPLLGISAGEKEVTRVEIGKKSDNLLKFTAPKDGDCVFSDTFKYGDGNVEVMDSNFRELERESFRGDGRYHLKGGQSYYVNVFVTYKNEAPYIDITTEYIPEVVALKVVKEPVRKEVYREFIPDLPGLAFEVSYSNGTKQVIYPAGQYETPNEEYFKYKFNYPANELNPPKGTYDMTYSIGGKSVTFKDVKVKEKTDLPTINANGKATAYRLADGGAYVRLTTGKYQRFVINNNNSEATCCNGGRIFEIVKNGKATAQAFPANSEILLYVRGSMLNLADIDFNEKVTFEAKPASKFNIAKTDIELSASTCAYTGKAVKPKLTIKDGYFYTLKEGTDYTVTYSNNTNIGTGKVTIKAKGNNYTGSVTKTFKIALGTPKLKSAKSTKAKSVTLTWNKVTGATSYKVYVKVGSKWKAIGTTKGTSFVHNSSNKYYKAQSGKTYTYTVKAERKSGSKTYTSSYNKTGIKAKVK